MAVVREEVVIPGPDGKDHTGEYKIPYRARGVHPSLHGHKGRRPRSAKKALI